MSAGLTTAEARERLQQLGPNIVAAASRTPIWRRIASQLKDPLMIVLLCAAALTLATGDYPDAAVILTVVVVNSTVGVAQEIRADRAITALAVLSAPRARVVRDGLELEIPSADVVPGDLFVVAEGDLVPADADLIEAAALLVDESSLTGESVPVDKATTGVDDAYRHISAGTVVVRGRARAIATATGRDSATGHLAVLLSAAQQLTPLRRRLNDLGRMLAVVVLGLCAVVLTMGLLRGQPLQLMIITAVSLAVAAVPESLPAVVTLSLAVGARRMAERNAIVRQLAAVEALGSVSVIATDKTGTVTEGSMVVQDLWTPIGEAHLTGTGYRPSGALIRANRPGSAAEAQDLGDLLRAAVLCTDAHLGAPDKDHQDWHALGDPTEVALIVAGEKIGLHRTDLSAESPRVAEFPFDSGRKRMTTVHRYGGGYLVISKGAPESLLHDLVTGDKEFIEAATNKAHQYATAGLRVLAVASDVRSDQPTSAEDAEHGLHLLGLIAITDPPKTSAPSTIAAIQQAGVTPILITGDHPATANAIARQVGIGSDSTEVVDGRNVDMADPSALLSAPVVARATPEQKVAIINGRQRRGQIIAMTGDGVNDGPALRSADVGVAMGQRGTEVARQAADVVLADDELATLVTAVGEGRRIYANIRRFLLFGMSGGAAEIIVMLAGPFVGMPLPLLPAQILWINLMTHGLVGVALGAEPADEMIMRRPPRPSTESVLGAGLWKRILRIAVLLAAVTLAGAGWALITGGQWQTMAFLTLGLSQLGVALALRARPRTFANPFLLVAIASAAVLQLCGVYLPPLAQLLGTRPLQLAELGVALLLSLLGYVGIRLDRVLHPR